MSTFRCLFCYLVAMFFFCYNGRIPQGSNSKRVPIMQSVNRSVGAITPPAPVESGRRLPGPPDETAQAISSLYSL